MAFIPWQILLSLYCLPWIKCRTGYLDLCCINFFPIKEMWPVCQLDLNLLHSLFHLIQMLVVKTHFVVDNKKVWFFLYLLNCRPFSTDIASFQKQLNLHGYFPQQKYWAFKVLDISFSFSPSPSLSLLLPPSISLSLVDYLVCWIFF